MIRTGPVCASASSEQKFSPPLGAVKSPFLVMVLHSERSSQVLCDQKQEDWVGSGSQELCHPLSHKVIQMLVGALGTEQRDRWWVRRGRAGCALAGPHPVALIFLSPPPPSLSFSLSHRSSAGAVTPVILLSISSLTPSFLYLFPSPLPPSQKGLHVSPDNNGVRI